jgi:hypothetical protein
VFVPEEGILLIGLFQQKDKALVISDVCLIIGAQVHLDYFGLLELLLHCALGRTQGETLSTHSLHFFSQYAHTLLESQYRLSCLGLSFLETHLQLLVVII